MTLAAIRPWKRRVRSFAAPCRTPFAGQLGSVLPVTIETPAHRERHLLSNARHRLHRAVTRRAAHAAGDVLTVVEVDEVRKVVDLGPRNRLLPLNGLFELLDLHGLRAQDRMAVHADIERRDPSVPAPLRARVGKKARELGCARMPLV